MAQGATADPGAAGRTLESAHRDLLTRTDLQFEFEAAKMRVLRKSPNWLDGLFDWVGGLFSLSAQATQILVIGAIAAVALCIAFVVVREMGGLDWTRRKPKSLTGDPLYMPDAETAMALLSDADALAAQGRYEEAVHALLLRSVEDMRRWRPRAVEPSYTSRDLETLTTLPQTAREAFSAMARLVETSLFGGRPVGADGFAASRKAYADFALPGHWA